jgi:hippurate hydrolase
MYRCFLVGFLSLILCVPATKGLGDEPRVWIERHVKDLAVLYQHLHAHPELSFQECETVRRLAQELTAVGAEVTTGVGGHGVVAVLRNGEGPTVMVRTDLDALPLVEQTGLPYASKITTKDESGAEVGVMHACGHDLHMTNLVGVARYLAAHKDRWRGTVVLVGQPAEERGAGAKAMLADGLFRRFPRPDYALALHVDSGMPAGSVGYRAGSAMANVDAVDITVRGRGGHGAAPHTTIDAIVQAAQLVLALQTIVSRELDPTQPAVVTVGSIHGGTKHNIIPSECHLQLTVRSHSDDVREQLLSAIERKTKAVAAGAGAPEPTVEFSEGTPSLYNDEDLTRRIVPVFRKLLGEDKVVQSKLAMVGEDFGQFGRAGVPIMMFRLGAVDAKRLARYEQLGRQPPSLHSPLFYPDVEPTLVTGVTAMAGAVLELLKP